MAEALATVGVVAAIVKLVEVTRNTIRVINELREKSSRMTKTIEAIGTECKTLQSALPSIKSWAESESRPLTQVTSVKKVVDVLGDAINALLADLMRINDSFRARLSFLWNDESLRLLLTEVRWQANALQFLLSALALPAARSQKRIYDLSESASVRYATRGGPDGAESTISEKQFAFDDEVVDSAAYRRALVAASQPKAPSKPAPKYKVFLIASNSCSQQGSSETCCMSKELLDIMSFGGYKSLDERCASNIPGARSLGSRITDALPVYPNESWESRWRLYIYCAPCIFQNDIALSICGHIVGFNGFIRIDDRLSKSCSPELTDIVGSMLNMENLIDTANDEWRSHGNHKRSWFTSDYDLVWLQKRTMLLELNRTLETPSVQALIDQAEQDQRVAAIIVLSSVDDIERILYQHPLGDSHQVIDGVIYQLNFDGSPDEAWTSEIFAKV